MPEMADSIFIGVKALYTADSGAGTGIGDTTDAGGTYVRHFVRQGDPNTNTVVMHNWPSIIVDVDVQEDRGFGERHVNGSVRMHLYTQRDQNHTDLVNQNLIGNRLVAVYDGAQMTTQGSVTFSILTLIRNYQAPGTAEELHRVYEFAVRSPSALLGRQATVAWSGAEIDETKLYGHAAVLGIRRVPVDIRLFHDISPRVIFDLEEGRSVVRFWVDQTLSTAPPKPTGTVATLTISTVSGNTYTIAAAISDLNLSFNSRSGEATVVGYDFIVALSDDVSVHAEGAAAITVA